MTASFPAAPASVFLVGIGGIGMSGLAQLLRSQGYAVAGSDRQMAGPGRGRLIAQLEAQGIRCFPQDGSGVRAVAPEILIASAAIEEQNPDFLAAPGIPRWGRAQALAAALNRSGGVQIAVAGSCGKTSVTGWLSATLRALGKRVLVVNGGYLLDVAEEKFPGNFSADADPEFLVYEVDESDKSLVEFSPDFGVLLNLGRDHHEPGELRRIFGRFLENCSGGVVLPEALADEFSDYGPEVRETFAAPGGYSSDPRGICFTLPGVGEVRSGQHGRHSALNAAAVAAVLWVLGVEEDGGKIAAAIGEFSGVAQRFEYCGRNGCGAPVYNDYAHNVDKIRAALQTAQAAAGGGVLAFFQPHGFGPLGFMADELGEMLRETLRKEDRFILLPVYYAGGTTSFHPTAVEVAERWLEKGIAIETVADLAAGAELAAADSRAAFVVVMGARDPGLPAWTRSLVGKD